jgi:hypothetical protein
MKHFTAVERFLSVAAHAGRSSPAAPVWYGDTRRRHILAANGRVVGAGRPNAGFGTEAVRCPAAYADAVMRQITCFLYRCCDHGNGCYAGV